MPFYRKKPVVIEARQMPLMTDEAVRAHRSIVTWRPQAEPLAMTTILNY